VVRVRDEFLLSLDQIGLTQMLDSAPPANETPGPGLGLPIVHAIVKAHHGHIKIDTGTTGTCVDVELPIHPPATPSR
jgi:signal transduction histidine kinase